MRTLTILVGIAYSILLVETRGQIRVPQDAPTLAAAVAQANDGDVIEVAPGTWVTPMLVIADMNLTIRGYAGCERTVLQPLPGEALVDFEGTGPEVLRLEGLAFVGCAGTASPVTVRDARLVCVRCCFESNICVGKGGALSILALQHPADLVLQSCRMLWNHATVAGGCINLEVLDPDLVVGATISSTLFRGNSSDLGTILYGDNAGTLLVALNNATIWGNFGAPFGALCHVISEPGRTAFMGCINDIIRGNVPNTLTSSDGSHPGSSFIVTTVTSNVEGGLPGFFNQDVDPAFVDPDAGDFRLQADSPCIDVGGGAASFIAWDLEGGPRLQGQGLDLGAYEYRPFFFLPGSHEGLSLSLNVYHSDGAAYPLVAEGDAVHLFVTPRASFVAGIPIALVAQISAQGARPSSPDEFPEVHVNPWSGPTPILLIDPFDPAAANQVLGNVVHHAETIPAGLAGQEVVVQAFGLTDQAANGFFVASDAAVIPVY